MKRFLLLICLFASILLGKMRPWYNAPPYYGRILLIGNFQRPTFDAIITQTVKTETKTFNVFISCPTVAPSSPKT